jgi:hypothetical protein
MMRGASTTVKSLDGITERPITPCICPTRLGPYHAAAA